MDVRDMLGRPRVYIMVRRGKNTMTRVLDLAQLEGQPIAVVTWVIRDRQRVPGRYFKLDPSLLRTASPAGAFQYEGIVEDGP